MSTPVRWGIIGPGNIARKFAEDLMLVEGAVLQGVASRDAGKARQFAETFGAVSSYGSYEALVKDPEVDIVYVATPHVFHYPHAMLCLQYGKAVLCEKPFGMNAREVEGMLAEAKARDLFIMEAFWTRFIPGIIRMQEIIQSGAIGEIEYIRSDFGFLGDPDPQKRVYNKSLGGGSMMDIGIYPVYLALLLLGVPDKIQAIARLAHTGVDSLCAMLFDYAGGPKAILESTVLATTPTEALIVGSKGSLTLHKSFHHTEKISLNLNGQAPEIIEEKYTGNGYFHEIVEVMECLRQVRKESPKMSHAMSLDLIRTLDRVRKEIGLLYVQDDPV
ncbi:MAG: Gfo/Idh/MocA family oxidoreductase [Bacteroides sp.]|jgi:predicted dehydrogenase|nr:Gfo/Idh/MocA family oxidoreductase [Bacteroides sp.]